MFGRVMTSRSAHDMYMALKYLYGDFSIWDDGKFKKEDDHMEMVHEDVEHDHNLAIVEDCSTSWSSDDDERSTTSSLDKVDDDAPSDANGDATPYTLDGNDDGSCSDDIATTSSSTTSHCFMSQGDTNVSNTNVIDLDAYKELLDRFGSMIKALEKEMAKIKKLKNENSFLKKSCEQQKHLLYVTTCLHEELKLAHEELSIAHDNLVQNHAFVTNKLSNEEIKTSESSSHG
jgi:hypothetical protein